MRDLESPTSFGGVKSAKLNCLARYSRKSRRDSETMGGVWSGWGFWVRGISFIAVVMILILTSWFISNYPAQAYLIPTTYRYPVSRSTPSPFAKFPRTTHHNATRCLRSHFLALIALHDPLSFYHSEVVVAVPCRVGIPYPGTSTRMIPVPDPLTSMLLG